MTWFVKGSCAWCLTQTDARKDHPHLVAIVRRVDALLDLATGGPLRRILRHARLGHAWPVASGTYLVDDGNAPLDAELAKAEAALRLGVHYEQDRPLRTKAETVAGHDGQR